MVLSSSEIQELDDLLDQFQCGDDIFEVSHAIGQLCNTGEQGRQDGSQVVRELVRPSIEEVTQVCQAEINQLDGLHLIGILNLVLVDFP